ncbi:MAG: protoporphyrinogen oxidase [Planctomycetota bacterium]
MVKRIAIIGGGISGLAAALECSKRTDKCDFQLFESSNRLGGVIETLQEGDYLIEKGADNFATLLPSALDLSQEFAAADDLTHPEADNRRAFVLKNGVPEPIPLGFSLMQPTQFASILATRTLSPLGKLRLLSEYFIEGKQWQDEEDESLESFAVRRLGREAFEALVEPIVSGIFTADPSKLSMRATMPQFVKMEQDHGGLIRAFLHSKKTDAAAIARKASGARYDQFVAPKQGMTAWIEQLSQRIPVENLALGVQVTQVQQRAGGWQVGIDRNGIQDLQDFDAVVLATPAAITSSLLQSSKPDVAALVGKIHYASSAVAALVVKKSELFGRTDGFGLICPRREGRRALAISYSSNKYAGRVPNDEILLRIFFGGALDASILDQSDEDLLRLAKLEISELLNWRGTECSREWLIRWPNAMPQYDLGHQQRVGNINKLVAATPSLALCGAAYSGVGIPQCVRSGRAAVKQLLDT